MYYLYNMIQTNNDMKTTNEITETFKVTYTRGYDRIVLRYMSDDSVKYGILEGEKYMGHKDWTITDKTIKELIAAGGSNCGEWTSEF